MAAYCCKMEAIKQVICKLLQKKLVFFGSAIIKLFTLLILLFFGINLYYSFTRLNNINTASLTDIPQCYLRQVNFGTCLLASLFWKIAGHCMGQFALLKRRLRLLYLSFYLSAC